MISIIGLWIVISFNLIIIALVIKTKYEKVRIAKHLYNYFYPPRISDILFVQWVYVIE